MRLLVVVPCRDEKFDRRCVRTCGRFEKHNANALLLDGLVPRLSHSEDITIEGEGRREVRHRDADVVYAADRDHTATS